MSFKHLHNRQGFFSDYYLGTIFGRGSGRGSKRKLFNKETEKAFWYLKKLHQRVEGRELSSSELRERFARPVLQDILDYYIGDGQEGLYPLYKNSESPAAGEKPILMAFIGGTGQEFDPHVSRRKESPRRQLEQALTEAGIDYGLMINDHLIRLIRRPGDGPKAAYIELDIEGCFDDEDGESFAAARLLFRRDTFIVNEFGEREITAIEAESRSHAEKVSDDLKRAVFVSAESLIGALLQDKQEQSQRTGEKYSPSQDELRLIRDAALLCLYRLLFILYAEAWFEKLVQHDIYFRGYSLAWLVEQLYRVNSQELPENRYRLWPRLVALFRVYDNGLMDIPEHENIPPRGGDFFSETTPEGKLLADAKLDDRIVANLVLSLATTAPRRGVGRERVSFRELGIEQLGAVYEGLLEYEPKIADKTLIEIKVQGKAYALEPSEVVRLVQMKNLELKGQYSIVQGTDAGSLHPDYEEDDEFDVEGLDMDELEDEKDENGDEEEDEGVKKGATCKLVRRFEPGDFLFIPGSARKGSGSYYTPEPIVDDIVEHALGPLVEGKSSEQILNIRVLDPATGSGHFLIGAMRFLGQALHKAYVKECTETGPDRFKARAAETKERWDTDWKVSDKQARASGSAARAWCKRQIAERCLYGVDLNPTAVMLARVALWIESLAGDRPLSYFEHHIRCGNSLIGTWSDRISDPPVPFSNKNLRHKAQLGLYSRVFWDNIQKAANQRRLIDIHPDTQEVKPETVAEIKYKKHLTDESRDLVVNAKLLFDLRCAAAFGLEQIWSEFEVIASWAIYKQTDPRITLEDEIKKYAWYPGFKAVQERERFFHWEIEFPEVFQGETPGFDAVLGNPPWEKVLPDKKEFYGRADVLIRAYVGEELNLRIKELHEHYPGLSDEQSKYVQRIKHTSAFLKNGGDYPHNTWLIDGDESGGHLDLFKIFVEQAHRLSKQGGNVGFLVPSAIYCNEGCTGIRHLLLYDSVIERFFGFENRKKIFNIHSSYKFVALVFQKNKPDEPEFLACFMRNETSELKRPMEPLPEFIVTIKRDEIERLSPGTLAFLEYRSPRDREIALKMYEGRPLLGDQGPGTWNARFYTEFNMTNDKDLWTDPKTGKLFTVKQVLGDEPADFEETRTRMAEEGFWPLYEGKHIEQFLVNIKPIYRWVNLEITTAKFGKPPNSGPKLVFRAIARNTDERTFISAVLPPGSCFGNTLSGLDARNPEVLLSVLNSLIMDFIIRLKTAGMHLSFTCVARLPIALSDFKQMKPIKTIIDFKRLGSLCRYEEYWPELWQLNLDVAKAYNLDPLDFELILSRFPVFARKRPEFFQFLSYKLAEWKYEEGLGPKPAELPDGIAETTREAR